MRCDEFQERWQELLDTRQLPEHDHELREHAEICAECGELLTLQTLIFRTARPTPQRGRALRVWGVGLALVVSMLVLVSPSLPSGSPQGGWLWSAWGWSSAASPTWSGVVWLPRRVAGDLAETPAATPGEHTLVPATDSLSFVSERSGDEWTPPPADPEAFCRLVRDMAARIPEVPEANLHPLDHFAGSLLPFTSTISAVWDALRRSFPAEEGNPVPVPQAVRDRMDRWRAIA